AEKGRMAHLYGDIEHLVECEKHWNLDEDRQTSGYRIDLLFLVKRHHLLLEPHLVVFVAFLQPFHLGLELLHLAHGDIRLVGERIEQELDEHGERQDGEAEIAQDSVEIMENVEDRLGDPIEPAPVDAEIEARNSELLLIMVEQAHHLGSGKKMGRRLG